MPQRDNEFAKFDAAMKKLISVPHSEIKEQMDAEKKLKAKRKSKKTSALGRESREQD